LLLEAVAVAVQEVIFQQVLVVEVQGDYWLVQPYYFPVLHTRFPLVVVALVGLAVLLVSLLMEVLVQIQV
jgi:hypothetical protein